MDNNQNNGNKNNGRRSGGFFTGVIIFSLMALLLIWILRIVNSNKTQEISYNEFLKMIDESKVEKVIIRSETIEIKPVDDQNAINNLLFASPKPSLFTGKVEEDETLSKRLLAKGIEVEGEIPDNSGQIWYFILSYILPIVIFLGLGFLLFRRVSGSDGVGGIMNVGKSNAKVYVQKETGKTFKDVAGEDEAIESLQEVVDFLHNPDKYVKIGARLPKGALLVGPPGTGKTLLAKAVAGEAHVPFFSLTGSDFVELYVGVGASRVRDLFKEAEKNAPCIIFIDEIDAIGRSRDSKYGGGNEEREQTLNQLLSEMDGFDGKKGIIILAATNRPEILDKALLRPGRFDRRIIVEKPDLKGRIEILKVHAKDVLLDETVDFDEIALATSGAVGSDLANMINEAAINAVKNKREYVSQKDLFNAVEIVLVGKEKKDRILSKQERKIVSYHEVGHALLSALQKNSEPVQKITIVPRTMGALGYVMQVPEEEKYLNSKEELHDMIVGLLGGRAAEEIVFGSVTTGASNDIEKATKIARSMVTQYGMSEKFGLVGLESVESRYLDGRTVMNCADRTAAEVDDEVISILANCYEEAKKLLMQNREIMDKIAAHLIEKETITGKEFMEIYCAEKGIPVPEPKAIGAKKKLEEERKQKQNAEKKDDPENGTGEAEKSENNADGASSDKENNAERNSTDDSVNSDKEKTTESGSAYSAESSENGTNKAEKSDDNSGSNSSDESANSGKYTENGSADSEKNNTESSEDKKDEETDPEEAEIAKAREEISKEVFNNIQNRAFKFDDDENK
ncbi:MAG: ATP-dependent zinc metalloprotease FtsH [Lachnospiraceae bacterium]|nr:ATP-dependent zinc metalloprotease FtsH [Lachnospiraceae bacterium]